MELSRLVRNLDLNVHRVRHALSERRVVRLGYAQVAGVCRTRSGFHAISAESRMGIFVRTLDYVPGFVFLHSFCPRPRAYLYRPAKTESFPPATEIPCRVETK